MRYLKFAKLEFANEALAQMECRTGKPFGALGGNGWLASNGSADAIHFHSSQRDSGLTEGGGTGFNAVALAEAEENTGA